MNPSGQHENSHPPEPNNAADFVLILEERDEPIDPHQREQLERRQRQFRERLLDERCSIPPECLKKLRIAAERLGISEGELICEGLHLVLEKHREQFGDLLPAEPPNESPKPETGKPST